MTNLELLKRVVEIVGYNVDFYNEEDGRYPLIGNAETGYEKLWNPLLDVDDAIRLALLFKFNIIFDFDSIKVVLPDNKYLLVKINEFDDMSNTLCFAIVRAIVELKN